jgi:hypothetical protein
MLDRCCGWVVLEIHSIHLLVCLLLCSWFAVVVVVVVSRSHRPVSPLLSFSLLNMQTMMEGYDPRKSKVSDKTMEKWTMSNVTADIQSVPGIGPAAALKLAADDGLGVIENTYQLFGKWLSIHAGHESDETDEPNPELTNQKFWFFLKAKGIHSQRSAIVKAVSDKLSSFMATLRPHDDEQVEDVE